jgi:hypothetical protein
MGPQFLQKECLLEMAISPDQIEEHPVISTMKKEVKKVQYLRDSTESARLSSTNEKGGTIYRSYMNVSLLWWV